MRKFIVIALALVAFGIASHAQNSTLGGVFFGYPVETGKTLTAFNFAIGGGLYTPSGGNFSYANAAAGGPFDLTYFGTGCPDGCSFHGKFTKWNPAFYPGGSGSVQQAGKASDCFLQTGLVSGTLTIGSDTFQMRGLYSQPFCSAASFWDSTGGLTLYF